MTKEKKQIISTWFNVVYKFIVMGLLGVIFIQAPKMLNDIKVLTFDNIDDKVNTKNHVNNSLDPITINELKGHIHNPDYHMPKKQKDSVYVTRKDFDELVNRTVITNYQTKEDVKEIKILIKELSKNQ